MNRMLLAVAAAFVLAGGAYAADTAMKMDCCKECACCKKAPAPKDGEKTPQTPPQAPSHQH
jgi:hypothetical protein